MQRSAEGILCFKNGLDVTNKATSVAVTPKKQSLKCLMKFKKSGIKIQQTIAVYPLPKNLRLMAAKKGGR